MNNAQAWATIGIFATSTFTMLWLTSSVFTRTLQTSIAGLRDELGAKIDGKIDSLTGRLDGKLESLEARLDGKIDSLEARMDTRFTTLESKVDHLDQDISAIVRRVFPEGT